MATQKNRTPRPYLLAIFAVSLVGLLLFASGTAAKPSTSQATKGSLASVDLPDPQCPPSWNARAPYPISIMDNAVVTQGNFLYSFGGRITSYNQTGLAYRYDPFADAWTQIASLPEARQAASALSDGTYIYVINGWRAGATPTNTVFRYDPISDSYTLLPPFSIPTAWQVAVFLNGKIYRIGGWALTGTTATVEVYGQGMVAPLPQPRGDHMAMTTGGYIYVAGGSTAGTKTYRYDPVNDVWEDNLIPDLPTAYRDAASGVLDGRWILAGGSGLGYDAIGWDPGTGAWQYLTSLAQGRNEVSGGVVGGAMYAIGGRFTSEPTADNQQYYPIGCPTNTPTVTGTPPTWTPTITPTPTVTPTPTSCYDPNPVQNPGFESGSLPPWQIRDSAATPSVTTAQHHSGNYSALVGAISGSGYNGESSIYQQVTVPADGGTLSFWYLPGTCDPCFFDYQDAYITDLNGNILATVMHVEYDYAPWTNKTYDMAAFAGQTVRIEFLVHDDGFCGCTYMYVDDVAILVEQTCPSVTPPTRTPTRTRTPTVATNTPTSTVTGTPPTATRTSTSTRTLTPTPTPCGSGLIMNDGFETGTLAPWVILGTNPPPVVSNVQVHSGTFSALLGTVSGTEPNGDGSMYQQITVPTGGGILSYWWLGGTTDTITFDWQDAYITNSSGGILATIQHTCSNTAGWQNVTYDMAAFSGQTIRIEFLVHQDGFGDDTYMYVDDATMLTSGGCPTWTPGIDPTATPTSTPTVTPTSTPCYDPNPVQNPGFESGSLSPWMIRDSAATPAVTTAQHHSGNYSVLLGTIAGPEPDGDSSIYQQVTVPTGGGTLSFWYLPSTNIGGITFDWQDAYITDLDGNILATIMHRAEFEFDWVSTTYNMAAFAGQTIRIEFLVHQDGFGDVTSMYVDDIAILAPGPCATPTLLTSTPTHVAVSPTRTSLIVTATPTSARTPTSTATMAPAPPTPCAIEFTDVPRGSTFYSYIKCLACLGIINGYADGTFRPNNNVTRGQLAKMVSNAAGFGDPQSEQLFEDVPVGSLFFDYIGRLASRGYMSGYPCGGSGEPCGPSSLPYFRPANNATRGQVAKIVTNSVGFNDPIPPERETFEDVVPHDTFWLYIERASLHGVISGYPCGDPHEPCIPPQNRRYFRPGNSVTRGQASKMVSISFFASCEAEARK
jgi:hypothetical protein